MNYKKILTRITVVFAGILVLITFFSRTLVDMHIPRVELVFANQGVIRPTAQSSGIVLHADTERIFASASGRITYVAAQGDVLGRGDLMFALESDMRALQRAMTEAEHDRAVTGLNLERAEAERAAEQQTLTQMLGEPATVPTAPVLNLLAYDLELENNTNETERIQSDLASLHVLYMLDLVPRQDITNREHDLARLAQERAQTVTRREQAISNYASALEAHRDTVAAAERSHRAQIQAQRARILQMEFAITTHRMELERVQARLYEIAEQIDAGGITEVRLAGTRGRVVVEVMQGIEVGSQVNEGTAIMLTALRNNNFIIEASFPQIQDFIAVGLHVDATVGTETLQGRVDSVIARGGRNLGRVGISGGALRGGERAQVTVEGAATVHTHTVPLSAVREDRISYFILFVEAVPGRFGSRYYVRRMDIETVRSDASYAAITGRFGVALPEGPIIVHSDMPVQPNARVRIVG